MAMIATSDSTALVAIKSDVRTGKSAVMNRGASGGVCPGRRPNSRPRTTNIITGMPTVPNTPNGSRMKILSSSQVSLNSPRSMVGTSVANPVPGQPEEDVLECRQLGAEVGHANPMIGQTLDHVGH